MNVEVAMSLQRPGAPSWAAGYGGYGNPVANPPLYSEVYVPYSDPFAEGAPESVVDAGEAIAAGNAAAWQLPHEGTVQWGPADKQLCMRTMCGFISQEEAGWDLLLQCSLKGYAGVRAGCTDPACLPYAEHECEGTVLAEPEPYTPPPGPDTLPLPLPPVDTSDIVPGYIGSPMPSITGGGAIAPYPAVGPVGEGGSVCGFSGWIDNNKLLAVLAVAGGFLLLRR